MSSGISRILYRSLVRLEKELFEATRKASKKNNLSHTRKELSQLLLLFVHRFVLEKYYRRS